MRRWLNVSTGVIREKEPAEGIRVHCCLYRRLLEKYQEDH
jgi:hypothetical protein